jgi:uroporphyrinogen decarboxylase
MPTGARHLLKTEVCGRMAQGGNHTVKRMTKRERLEAAIRGEESDRPPVALWRHFPGDDQDPESLAASTLAFQSQYDFDFIKVTPASSFCVRDWGVDDRWVGNEEGTREYTNQPIRTADQWLALRRQDLSHGALAGQLRCLEVLQKEVGEETPFIQTIFNPLSQAKNLAGREGVLAQLREDPVALKEGLETITATTVDFVEGARERGIAGIFLAVQHASYELLSEQEYEEFGVPYDQRILKAADGLWLNVLHLHGSRVMFDALAAYPVHIVNWHDRETPPTLREGQARVRGAVLGGLRQWETMLRGSPDDVRGEAQNAMEQTGGRRFILGTGCVTPITAPWANLRAARAAVD